MKKQETFKAKASLSLENSFGTLKQEDDVELEVTVGIRENGNGGWFEIYDFESGGDEWYAEGCLEIEGMNVVGYDGCFSLPIPVLDKLKEWGYDVSEVE